MYTNEDLKAMQAWPLERKVQVTQTRILEFGLKFDKQIYVSFSGGKDSTVLLDLVRRVFPDTPAVFVDTGLEYPEIKEFVKTIPNVTWLKPEMNFRKVIETYGYPLISKDVAERIYCYRRNPNAQSYASRFDDESDYNKKYNGRFSMSRWINLRDSDIPVSHMCCNVMKKKPVKKYEKTTKLKPILGTMACEGRLRKIAWLKNGCNSFEGKRQTSQPMSFWTEQDILEYITQFNLPYASVYGEILQDKNGKYCTTGCKRTGCVFCGFGCHLEKEPNRFQRLKQTHPKLWKYCMKPWDKGGLGMKDVLEYIGVECEIKNQQISVYDEAEKI